MNKIITVLLLFTVFLSFSQEEDKAELLALKKANNYVYEGNSLLEGDDAVLAEMAYRKAISEQPNIVVGNYNLGTSYIKNGNFDEAVFRLEEAAKVATSKSEKHKAFHNIGNVLMQAQKCKEAVEAYKNALRNNPSDEETRYNLALAKDCAEQQQDQNQDQDQDQNEEDKDNSDDKQDENKENQDNQDNQDNKDGEGDENEDQDNQEENEGEDEQEEDGKPEDDKQDKGNEGDDEKEQQQPKPQPGQLSPQQIQNLLEAMNNQEQKVQEKMNAEKQKGVIIQTDKDW